jgi:hypothetical protein
MLSLGGSTSGCIRGRREDEQGLKRFLFPWLVDVLVHQHKIVDSHLVGARGRTPTTEGALDPVLFREPSPARPVLSISFDDVVVALYGERKRLTFKVDPSFFVLR